MGFFSNTNRKSSHIDRSTGRNKRDKSPIRGSGAPRRNGKVVDRAEWRRSQRTGRPMQRKSWIW